MVREGGIRWGQLLQIGHRASFYRPLVDVWFTGAIRVCGASVPCYHLANLGIHLLNILLVFALARTVLKDVRSAFLASVLFAAQPAPMQAVVWVAAVSGLLALATACYLASLLMQALSWRASNPTARRVCDVVALLFFAAGHEAVATLPVMSWTMWQLFGPKNITRRVMLTGGMVTVTLLFAVVTVLANQGHTLFTEAHYAVGLHAISHGL